MSHQQKIYESPDGGHTVYERTPGESTRRLIKQDAHARSQERYYRLAEICRAAEHDAVLKDLLDQAESYWKLKYG